MITSLRTLWQNLNRQAERATGPARTLSTSLPRPTAASTVEIAPDDPVVAYFQRSLSLVDVDQLDLDSPVVRQLKASGVKLAVPLVSQGELVGLLNLGPRLSEQEYSADDRALLNNLSNQAAPALRVAQLVRQQQVEALQRERIEQELRVARLIQHALLPKELPALPGWDVATYYQPARAVGGDFYDFLYYPDGRIGLVIGDVTDKGVPAALLMATTRTILRGAALQQVSPGQVLERANEALVPDIPPKMFVTCLFAILDPGTGRLQFANAGHDLPYRRNSGGVSELHARGMPLGLMPGMRYEENEVTLEPGDSVLFYSDGLVEAHNSRREMFGFPHLKSFVETHPGGGALIDYLLAELAEFTGPDWEQEDDVTLVTLQRGQSDGDAETPLTPARDRQGLEGTDPMWRTLADFTIPSEPGNERLAMRQVADAVREVALSAERLERLKTAVAEAAMNALEHGNKYEADLPVRIRVRASRVAVSVQVTDHGAGRIPDPQVPNLEAKLAGLQSPRGWGLFLIRKMVDDMRVSDEDSHHTLELIMNLEGTKNGGEAA